MVSCVIFTRVVLSRITISVKQEKGTPMNVQHQLIMFDLDGTLVETGMEIYAAVEDTLAQFAFAPVSREKVYGWIGRGSRELLIQVLVFSLQRTDAQVRQHERLAEIEVQFAQHYQRHSGTTGRLYPQVLGTLQALKARGIKLAVVTNKDTLNTGIVLQKHGLLALFDLVIAGDTLPTRKPDPAGITHCLHVFKIPASAALFVGDSVIDAEAARNAGIQVWLLPYGYNMNQPVQSAAPDRVIDSLAALLTDPH